MAETIIVNLFESGKRSRDIHCLCLTHATNVNMHLFAENAAGVAACPSLAMDFPSVIFPLTRTNNTIRQCSTVLRMRCEKISLCALHTHRSVMYQYYYEHTNVSIRREEKKKTKQKICCHYSESVAFSAVILRSASAFLFQPIPQ